MKWNELCFDNDCLDLPSLTRILCNEESCGIHQYMGYVILESMIWFDLIIDINNNITKLDIPELKRISDFYYEYGFTHTYDLKATSIIS